MMPRPGLSLPARPAPPASGGAFRTVDPPRLCVVLHDVAPARWEGCLQVLAQVRAVAARAGVPLPVSLLVVPQLHGETAVPPAYLYWLQRLHRKGHELILHGFSHRDQSPPRGGLRDHLLRHWYTDGEGEFAAIDQVGAGQRLAQGLDWADRLALPMTGFVAPARLLGDGAWQALAAQPLRYTCTLGVFLPAAYRSCWAIRNP